MKPLLLTILALAAAAEASAQHAGHTADGPTRLPTEDQTPDDPHAGHDMPPAPPEQNEADAQDAHAGHDMETPPASSTAPHAGADMIPDAAPPPAAFAGPPHAADTLFDPAAMRAARLDLRSEEGNFRTWWVIADRAEADFRDGSENYLWDVQSWYGGDVNKIWLKSEGEGGFGESMTAGEVQALWSRAVTPWFDFRAGIRYDFRPDPERAHLVVGLQGLMPYKFEIDAAAFLSEDGDLSARFEVEYDQRITQRLLLQPRIELDLAAGDVPEIGIGSGLTSAELGLRLRYEFAREFAPYVGIEYERAFGDTADFVRSTGGDPSGWAAVVGVRAWF